MARTFKIVIVGTGNVAKAYAMRLQKLKSTQVVQIVGRNVEKSRLLADVAGVANFTNEFSSVQPAADLYILAVNDDAIEGVARDLSRTLLPQSCVVHTSGSVSITAVSSFFSNAGVLYPLQTMSQAETIKWSEVPVLIDATNAQTLKIISAVARKLSAHVEQADDRKRSQYHLAAVFANNFSNALLDVSFSYLSARGLSPKLILPLVEHTIRKLQQVNPHEAQTGPARRNDQATISKHLDMLVDSPDMLAVYNLMTQLIQKRHS